MTGEDWEWFIAGLLMLNVLFVAFRVWIGYVMTPTEHDNRQ